MLASVRARFQRRAPGAPRCVRFARCREFSGQRGGGGEFDELSITRWHVDQRGPSEFFANFLSDEGGRLPQSPHTVKNSHRSWPQANAVTFRPPTLLTASKSFTKPPFALDHALFRCVRAALPCGRAPQPQAARPRGPPPLPPASQSQLTIGTIWTLVPVSGIPPGRYGPLRRST